MGSGHGALGLLRFAWVEEDFTGASADNRACLWLMKRSFLPLQDVADYKSKGVFEKAKNAAAAKAAKAAADRKKMEEMDVEDDEDEEDDEEEEEEDDEWETV